MTALILELLPEITRIEDKTLQDKVARVWEEALEMGGWQNPEAIPFNAAIGNAPSLIDHTRSVTKAALWYAEHYQQTFGGKIDFDTLTAGAILHDVSKVIEFRQGDAGPEQTSIGKQLPHSTYSGFFAWKAGLPLEVLHLIVTHSPAVQMLPNTIEGYILKYVDVMDADAHYFSAGLPTIMERFKK